MLQNNIQAAVILEDDANINRNDPRLSLWLNELIHSNKTEDYDLLFIGYNWNCPIIKPVNTHLFEVDFSHEQAFHATHALILTQRGARKLLENARPYSYPVDVYMAKNIRQQKIKALQVMPYDSAIKTVPTPSDTQGIR